MYNVNTNIKELRIFTKLSQKDFAKKFYLDIGRIKTWEKRPKTTPQSVIDTIIERLRQEHIINNKDIRLLESKSKTTSRFKKETIKSKSEEIMYENH